MPRDTINMPENFSTKERNSAMTYFYQSVVNRKMEEGDQITHIKATGEMLPIPTDIERATGHIHKRPDLS